MEGQTDKMDVDHSQEEDREIGETRRKGRRNLRGWRGNGGLVRKNAPQTTLSLSLRFSFYFTLSSNYFLVKHIYNCSCYLFCVSLLYVYLVNNSQYSVGCLTTERVNEISAAYRWCSCPLLLLFLPSCLSECVLGSSFLQVSCSHT